MSDRQRSPQSLSRRRFVGASLAAVPALAAGAGRAPLGGQTPANKAPSKVAAYRTLGRTGYKVSDVSFGGGALSNPNVLAAALDRGVNYIDTAEHYAEGTSERTVGEVLGRRDRKAVFLTTKLNLSFFGG